MSFQPRWLERLGRFSMLVCEANYFGCSDSVVSKPFQSRIHSLVLNIQGRVCQRSAYLICIYLDSSDVKSVDRYIHDCLARGISFSRSHGFSLQTEGRCYACAVDSTIWVANDLTRVLAVISSSTL